MGDFFHGDCLYEIIFMEYAYRYVWKIILLETA